MLTGVGLRTIGDERRLSIHSQAVVEREAAQKTMLDAFALQRA